MQGFDEDYKDIKQAVYVGLVLAIVNRVVPSWILSLFGALLGTFILVFLFIGSIAMWRAGFYGIAWHDVIGPMSEAIGQILKVIVWVFPKNMACYIFTGNWCNGS